MVTHNVIVLDALRTFLEYTSPATARKLIKSGNARVYSRDPFAIQLIKQVDYPDQSRRNNFMAIKNFTKFFSSENDIYAQNISNCQVVVQFESSTGQTIPFTFAPNRDPVNLTAHVPWSVIKSSADFRKILMRVPSVVTLIDEQQYLAYYQNQARIKGLKSVDDAIDAAETRRTNRSPLPDAPPPAPVTEQMKPSDNIPFVSEDDVVNSRILNLCLQVNPAVPDPQKMTAQQMLTELEIIPDLTYEDWDYVASHGYYKTVINFAKKNMNAMAVTNVFDDTTEEVAVVPKPAKKAKKAKPSVVDTSKTE